MPIKNLTLGAVALLAGAALAQNHHNSHITPKKHIVRKGETLDKIAIWTGVSKKQLILANNLYTKKFKPGLALYIPATSKASPAHYNLNAHGYAPYTIRAHDSDWKIANMFHMAPKDLHVLNPNVSWSHPHPGSQIRIPMRNAFLYKLAKIPVIRSRYAMVTRPDTVVRDAPGSNAHRIVKVDAGRQVRVLDRDDHWYKVRFEHGTEGWVRGDLLAAEQPTIVAEHHVAHRYQHRHETRMASYHPPQHHSPVRGTRNAGTYASLPNAGGDMLSFAQSMQGTPYSYGSASRHATDCSGFTLQVLKNQGIKLPRTAAEQSRKGQHVAGGDMKPGDLVFFHTRGGGRISHVGIYMGNGKFIHASSGGGKVQVNSLDEKYYKHRFATARRVAKIKHPKAESDDIAQSQHDDTAAMKQAEKEIKTTSKVTDAVGD